MHECPREKFEICIHNTKCFACVNESLYDEPKWMKQQKKQKEKTKKQLSKINKKDGLAFEKEVTKKYNKWIESKNKKNNKSFETPAAKQQIGSGALWFAPSDVITENELIECKERGNTTSRGEKTISIQKKWLDKVKNESYLAGKNTWFLTFKYKDSSDIYLIKEYEHELAQIQYIKQLEEKIKELEEK